MNASSYESAVGEQRSQRIVNRYQPLTSQTRGSDSIAEFGQDVVRRAARRFGSEVGCEFHSFESIEHLFDTQLEFVRQDHPQTRP